MYLLCGTVSYLPADMHKQYMSKTTKALFLSNGSICFQLVQFCETEELRIKAVNLEFVSTAHCTPNFGRILCIINAVYQLL